MMKKKSKRSDNKASGVYTPSKGNNTFGNQWRGNTNSQGYSTSKRNRSFKSG